MRCLTLANALRARGSTVTFVCREHEGHLCDQIDASGFAVCRLPAPEPIQRPFRAGRLRRAWLGVSQDTDADQTLAVVIEMTPRRTGSSWITTAWTRRGRIVSGDLARKHPGHR